MHNTILPQYNGVLEELEVFEGLGVADVDMHERVRSRTRASRHSRNDGNGKNSAKSEQAEGYLQRYYLKEVEKARVRLGDIHNPVTDLPVQYIRDVMRLREMLRVHSTNDGTVRIVECPPLVVCKTHDKEKELIRKDYLLVKGHILYLALVQEVGEDVEVDCIVTQTPRACRAFYKLAYATIDREEVLNDNLKISGVLMQLLLDGIVDYQSIKCIVQHLTQQDIREMEREIVQLPRPFDARQVHGIIEKYIAKRKGDKYCHLRKVLHEVTLYVPPDLADKLIESIKLYTEEDIW